MKVMGSGSNRARRKAKIMVRLRPCVRQKHDLFFGRNVFRFSVSDVAGSALIVDILMFSFNWWLYRVYILRSDSMSG